MIDASSATASGRYHHGDLRRELLTVARALLAEVGPEAVSLREVARNAGVSSRAPYRHFASKDALMSALATEGFEALTAALRVGEAAPAPGRRLRTQALAYIHFALDHRALYRLMFSYRMQDAGPALARAKAATQAVLARSVRTERGGHVAARALGCWALVHGLAVLAQEGLIGEAAGEPVDGLLQDAIDVMLPPGQG